MRDDVLARRMFIAGCFGLPWLWAVHSLYWYRKQRPNHVTDEDHQDALLATNSSSDTDGTSRSTCILCQQCFNIMYDCLYPLFLFSLDVSLLFRVCRGCTRFKIARSDKGRGTKVGQEKLLRLDCGVYGMGPVDYNVSHFCRQISVKLVCPIG
jgi:hypothetical protein